MKQHILFVDDEVPLRETLSLYFKMKGIAVTAAENRKEAIRLAEKSSFNLAIVDIHLGGENGLELLTFFKRTYPNLPVIMFTSLGYDPALVKEAVEKGAHAYLSKTESLDSLLKEAQRAMA
jgi:DNA-binding NtrC family response regulator